MSAGNRATESRARREEATAGPLEGFRQGRREAHELVRGWIETVVRFGRWRFTDPEGVVQEVLLKLLLIAREQTFEGASSFKTFVVSVARYTCIDLYRHEKHRATFAGEPREAENAPAPRDDPERRLRDKERIERLRYIHQKLPEECRRLWRLVYGEGLPAVEVAKRLGIGLVNVRVRIHRCLGRAREIHRQFLSLPMRREP